MTDATKPAQPPITVLCVDDEHNILKSIKRTLHKLGYKILLASSGQEGLEHIAKQPVHLVLSDMKMPEMNGAQFLKQVASKRPDTYRILLTGYSDMESTIAAINHGKIHRYLQKPWNNESLIEAVEMGVKTVKLQQHNEQLQALTKAQNNQLQELNRSLEEKVKLRTKQIRAALKKIEQEQQEVHSMLVNFISISPELDGGFAKNVSSLAVQIASELGLEATEVKSIELAGLLNEIGLLGLPPRLSSMAFSELSYPEQKMFYEQSDLAREILGPASHLAQVTDIIASQFEHYNGKGLPKKLVATDIPVGGRILHIARDYWRHRSARIEPVKLDDKETKQAMNKFRSSVYDPKILDVLIGLQQIDKAKVAEDGVRSSDLLPGMRLKHSLFSDKHILILPEGHVFTETTIRKLMHYEKSRNTRLSILINESDCASSTTPITAQGSPEPTATVEQTKAT